MVKKIFSKKRIFIIALIIIFAIITSVYLYLQDNDIVTSKIAYTSNKLPNGFNGYTIVQISDLHNKEFANDQLQIIDEINDAKPDIIVITGDLIDKSTTDTGVSVKLCERMMSIATVYYVSGNQENASGKYDELKSDLQSVGVRVLDNEFIKLSKNNETINLFGIEDFDFFNFGPDTGNDFSKNFQGEITNLVKGADGFKILLTHRPEYFDQYVACNIDLVFAGHAHGGQVRLPFIGALYAPGQGFFPKYTKGLYTIDQTSMIVSAGMGNSEFPFRINDPPEIVVAILHTN